LLVPEGRSARQRWHCQFATAKFGEQDADEAATPEAAHGVVSRDPQYEIKSDETNHVAMHKGAALHKIARLARRATTTPQRYRFSS
jgi:hypothetical protein